MKLGRNAWSVILLVACVPLAIFVLVNHPKPMVVVRFGTFNAALNRSEPGALLEELRGGASPQARKVAQIVQHEGIDVLLLCELDRDTAAATASVFADEYLAKPQGGERPIRFQYHFAAEVNTGEPSGHDLDGDGKSDGPGDAFGYGRFPGQYGMALLSRYPIQTAAIRTFRNLKWSAMPGNLMPSDFFTPAARDVVRLSSKSHWDVPIQLTEQGLIVHALCSHPTPPVFDGPEDRNGARNHDEIRFWVDYLTPERANWITDDAGQKGGLAPDQHFVLLGDLNCDPVDGDSRREALLQLLAHPRVQDPQPQSKGAGIAAKKQWGLNSGQQGDANLDTADFDDDAGKGPGNLRVDYVLPSRSLLTAGQAVFWPTGGPLLALATDASDHRLVWVDIRVDAVTPAPK